MLLWHDGFETGDRSPYIGYGTWVVNNITRFGYGSSIWSSYGGSGSAKKMVTPSAKMFAGVAVQPMNYGTLNLLEFLGDNGATQHITIRPNGVHGIDIVKNGVVIASSPQNVWADSTWIYVEASATISATIGEVHVRLNGGTTDVVSYIGNTKNGGTSTNIDAVAIGWTDVSENWRGRVDDFYVANDQGSVNNNFLGDVRVQTLVPTGPGSSTGMVASSGANWTCVDELPPSASDYVGSAVSGARDLYVTSDLVNALSVKGVRLLAHMHKSDAGAASMKPAIKVGANVYYGTPQALPTVMTGYGDLMELNPATTAPWTVAEINAIEIGGEVV